MRKNTRSAVFHFSAPANDCLDACIADRLNTTKCGEGPFGFIIIIRVLSGNVAHLPQNIRVAPVEDYKLKLFAVVLCRGEAEHAGDVIMGDTFKPTCSHRRQMQGL